MALFEAGRCLLRQFREDKGITQQELADLAGISRSQLSAYERRKYTMNIEDARSFAEIFNCHIDDLYDWKRID
ncbi:helix-turn-helix transcriptional regulator [Paenibacillus sp. RUD330]|uniref:helix-turn-helix transcriptional regulator n=1 Tax=Paenibacillus sp. RUD330 TaxID=2023772 RepID=UPI000B92B84F|nr:helix-turn-helix transcriptional regulator [Paenibacillus sp. RUD330]ASS66251.1 helix-turn-helix transcriptional regulator [Paenibacillus sp. RUD330]